MNTKELRIALDNVDNLIIGLRGFYQATAEKTIKVRLEIDETYSAVQLYEVLHAVINQHDDLQLLVQEEFITPPKGEPYTNLYLAVEVGESGRFSKDGHS